MNKYRFILLVQQNYTFEILRPMQTEMQARGDQVLWLVIGNEVDTGLFKSDECYTTSIKQVTAFNPQAVFVTGNVVPDFIPGLKVQLFHGFEWKKKGHFRIRGSFDLYCTQGPLFTRKFSEFAKQHGYFDVVETGWPKMDHVFPLLPKTTNSPRQQILFLPTFSPALTSAPDLLAEIEAIAQHQDYEWVVKFHPKMAKDIIEQYQEMAARTDNVTVYDKADLAQLIRQCDLVLSDTSSAIAESILQRKPVVTYKNSLPDEYIIDFCKADELHDVIEGVFSNLEKHAERLEQFVTEYHPSSDGKASKRVIEAAVDCIENGLQAKKRKPINFLRNFKLRQKTNFWPWST